MSDWFINADDTDLAKVEKKKTTKAKKPKTSSKVSVKPVKSSKNEKPTPADIPKMRMVKRVGKILYSQPFKWDKKIKFHPSQIGNLCPHHYFFLATHYASMSEEESKALMEEYVKSERSSFNPESYPKMGQGTAMHSMLQYYGGLTHDLIGQWRCPQCGYHTDKDSMIKMPTVLLTDEFGSKSRMPDKCPKCKGNINTHDWAWVYVEPKFSIPKYQLEGQTDGIRVVETEKWGLLKGVVDYKTINNNGYQGKYMTLPIESHVLQTHVYAYAMKADFINLVYINKDTMAEKEFILIPDFRGVLGPVFKKIKAALHAVKVGKQPVKELRACNSIKCPRASKCPFAEKCFGKKRPINLLG